ncbi:glycosyltransferase family 2 protein [Liquorilactobacillus satsumensis]|uniref:Glycosyltransferase n=1 Tax=Liquorilactobacillus satsumensis DSM 16230 = JCM 12392 TaxID=1423801 RepID=A0A0R1UX27_9LACO|nr:glycosyltransferase family A protein [Liquorilactobacillus satsumensis]KRL97686.1 glycosyltransferase [Liquorilactobacillus satsumensis DSM 16230 = JCM 12392]
MMTKISVVVPVYNVAEYLQRCIESLRKQTMTAFEIILVDDGSTDSSGSICQSYSQKYPQLIKYYKKKNGGLSDARNYGMQFATGQYLLFIDSDDYVEPQMLANMYQQSAQGTKKIVECNFVWENGAQRKPDQAVVYDSIATYLVKGRVVAWNKLYRRDWLTEIGVTFPVGKLYEDQAFFFKTAAFLNNVTEIAVDRNCEVHYVQRASSISYAQNTKVADIFWIYQDILNFYHTRGCYSEYAQELEYRFCRNLFGNVLIRKVRKIKNKELKKQLLDQIWEWTQKWFPHWKKNRYLLEKNKVNYYLRSLNKLNYRFFYL